MYFELRQELQRVIQSEEFIRRVDSVSDQINFQIEEPTNRNFGLLASNLAFVISKKLKEINRPLFSPQVVAEVITALVNKDNFNLFVAGGGFINVIPTEKFFCYFFSNDYSPKLPIFSVDWSIPTLQEKILSSDEAVYFLKKLFNQKNELSDQDSLQLLSLLGDPEIDSNIYLRGLYCRDNVPNYLMEFRKVVKTLPVHQSSLENFRLDNLFEQLLLFQGRVDESLTRGHPERVMGLLLNLVRGFFSLYNRPDIRKSIYLKENIPFLRCSHSCQSQVIALLNNLQFSSCESLRTVL